MKEIPHSDSKVIVVLFEGAYFASFKIDDIKDDYIVQLLTAEDDMILDVFIPSIVAVVAISVLIMRRRRPDMTQVQRNNMRQQMPRARPNPLRFVGLPAFNGDNQPLPNANAEDAN